MSIADLNRYDDVVPWLEDCLKEYGDSHLAVGWPKAEDVPKRYRVMLDIIRRDCSISPVSILDFGCGAAHLLDYINKKEMTGINYSGFDISPSFIEFCRNKYPDTTFICADAIKNSDSVPEADYIIMNGIFTVKMKKSYDEWFNYMTTLLSAVFPKAKHGIAFNLMTKHLDWEREDLFHVPFDSIAAFIYKNMSRHFVFRHEFGPREYTVYIYREPLNC